MPRKRKVYGNCPYCGEYHKLTLDHVIPKSLFTKPLPGDIPKIYACATCNNLLKSTYDTDLRDLLLVDIDSSQSRQAQLRYPRFESVVSRNQSKMARAMRENSYLVELKLEPGVIAFLGYTSPEANEQMPKIMMMIVRGLYFYNTGKTLPPDIIFSGMRERNNSRCQDVIQLFTEACDPLKQIGDGSVFEYRFDIKKDDPNNSAWMLIFYERAVFIMITQSSQKVAETMHAIEN